MAEEEVVVGESRNGAVVEVEEAEEEKQSSQRNPGTGFVPGRRY